MESFIKFLQQNNAGLTVIAGSPINSNTAIGWTEKDENFNNVNCN